MKKGIYVLVIIAVLTLFARRWSIPVASFVALRRFAAFFTWTTLIPVVAIASFVSVISIVAVTAVALAALIGRFTSAITAR